MNWKTGRWILGTLLILQPSLGAQDKSARADSLYRQAVSRLATAPFCGLGNHHLGQFETASHFFSDALNRMTAEERSIVESVDLLGDRADRDIELASLNSFWKPQDSLYLTDYNERRMEHYARMAYANLRFSRPSKKVAGGRTGGAHPVQRF